MGDQMVVTPEPTQEVAPTTQEPAPAPSPTEEETEEPTTEDPTTEEPTEEPTFPHLPLARVPKSLRHGRIPKGSPIDIKGMAHMNPVRSLWV